ncbi:RING-H2 finger protein ATL44 [Acorus calamus]|uniref:RING-H2 finger protein ATL44 n=1 Tax=Acorus calamus TaxID=4465 RepID=A0AAV9DTA8_ACOCL|nr:RING-H2 finger protein ATL44 [Acorus calamus]KAK1304202.1 RING-H2 finger protein ATL44 [Acorus calamus]
MRITMRFLENGHHPSPSERAEPPGTAELDSDIVVIMAALFCALICLAGLALVARCAWLRRSPSGAPPPAPKKGLKKKALRSLPKASFTGGGGLAGAGAAAECPICLAEFAEGDEIRALPQCGHVFHVSCVDTWLESRASCPSCRRILGVATCQKCGGGVGVVSDDPNRFLP